MNILNTQIALNINLETTEDLKLVVNKLIEYKVFNYLITENKVALGTRDSKFNLLATSTLTSGYTLTIYSKSFIVVKLLEELDIEINEY